MEGPRILLYIGTFFIVVSICWTLIMESRKEFIVENLIKNGLPTPSGADSFQLQKIGELVRK